MSHGTRVALRNNLIQGGAAPETSFSRGAFKRDVGSGSEDCATADTRQAMRLPFFCQRVCGYPRMTIA